MNEKKELLEKEIETPLTYVERNGVYYQVPVWIKKDLELLEKLKDYLTIILDPGAIYINGFDYQKLQDMIYDNDKPTPRKKKIKELKR